MHNKRGGPAFYTALTSAFGAVFAPEGIGLTDSRPLTPLRDSLAELVDVNGVSEVVERVNQVAGSIDAEGAMAATAAVTILAATNAAGSMKALYETPTKENSKHLLERVALWGVTAAIGVLGYKTCQDWSEDAAFTLYFPMCAALLYMRIAKDKYDNDNETPRSGKTEYHRVDEDYWPFFWRGLDSRTGTGL